MPVDPATAKAIDDAILRAIDMLNDAVEFGSTRDKIRVAELLIKLASMVHQKRGDDGTK